MSTAPPPLLASKYPLITKKKQWILGVRTSNKTIWREKTPLFLKEARCFGWKMTDHDFKTHKGSSFSSHHLLCRLSKSNSHGSFHPSYKLKRTDCLDRWVFFSDPLEKGKTYTNIRLSMRKSSNPPVDRRKRKNMSVKSELQRWPNRHHRGQRPRPQALTIGRPCPSPYRRRIGRSLPCRMHQAPGQA